jgi:hypothetical protein
MSSECTASYLGGSGSTVSILFHCLADWNEYSSCVFDTKSSRFKAQAFDISNLTSQTPANPELPGSHIRIQSLSSLQAARNGEYDECHCFLGISKRGENDVSFVALKVYCTVLCI